MHIATEASQRSHQDRRDDEPIDTRPFLCIPYWKKPRFPGDDPDSGSLRKLPNDVISWDCESIHTSLYKPGDLLEVAVDVRNSGHGNAASVPVVMVYWADPTAGFAAPLFFGATNVPVDPRGAYATTLPIVATIPDWAPDHICLLARVFHPLDQGAQTPDPINDRHWAQRNLVFLRQRQIVPLSIPFFAGNPFSEESEFELRVNSIFGPNLERIALRWKAEPAEFEAHFQVVDDRGQPVTDKVRDIAIQVYLGPRKQKRFYLMIEMDELAPHQLIALEAAILALRNPEHPLGSLGFIVGGDDVGT